MPLLQGDEQSGMSISLPRVNSAELLLFPETAEGHVSKVQVLAVCYCTGHVHRCGIGGCLLVIHDSKSTLPPYAPGCMQVRWYSFQFLMEELAEEFQEMHVALTALLIKLPDGVIKLT